MMDSQAVYRKNAEIRIQNIGTYPITFTGKNQQQSCALHVAKMVESADFYCRNSIFRGLKK